MNQLVSIPEPPKSLLDQAAEKTFDSPEQLLSHYKKIAKKTHKYPPPKKHVEEPKFKHKTHPWDFPVPAPVYQDPMALTGEHAFPPAPPKGKPTEIEKIIYRAAFTYKVWYREMFINTRRKPVVYARAQAAAQIRAKYGWSYTRIGKHFGNYDHSTVIHWIDLYKKDLEGKEPLFPKPRNRGTKFTAEDYYTVKELLDKGLSQRRIYALTGCNQTWISEVNRGLITPEIIAEHNRV